MDLFRGIIPAISHYSQNTVLLVASHPGTLDVLSLGWLSPWPVLKYSELNTLTWSKILALLKDVFLFSFEQDTVFEGFFFTVTKIKENSILCLYKRYVLLYVSVYSFVDTSLYLQD